MDKLKEARRTINDADQKMARLFEARMAAVKEVAAYKKEHGLPVEDLEREGAMFEKNAALIEKDELRPYYIGFLKKNIELSKDYQHRLLDGRRVAFAGVSGAFAGIAAKRIFPDCTAVPCGDFREAYTAVKNGDCDCAVLPLENSFAGDVAQVMDLAFFGSLYINGVYDLEVGQCLFGTQESSTEQIRTVLSHPQAISQCAPYLREHGIKALEEVNTAVAARKVAMQNDPTLAALCSEEAGEENGLKLLERRIEESGQNTTRFAVFSRAFEEKPQNGNFILVFTVRNEAGCLGKAVSVFGENGLNLKALKSRPAKDVIWQYYFFVEGEGEFSGEAEEKTLSALRENCTLVRLIGKYGKEIKI